MSRKVALMCGHGTSTNGSWDPGTTYGGYTEAALMLPITKAAVKYLRSWGVSVISDADTNNNKNMIVDCKWSDSWGAEVYVSLHCDWYKAGSGTLPLYVSSKGKQLATALNKRVMSGMSMKTRGVCKRTDLYELNYPDAISCIFETGSIKADISILKNKPDQYGKCIAQGIMDYLGLKIPAATTTTTTSPKTTTTTAAPKAAAELYRVRKAWADSKSQAGAYKILDNAKKTADEKGLNVYNSKGQLVYEGKKKAVNTTTWVDKANAWARKIAGEKYHYVTWKSKVPASRTCPICKGRKYNNYYGWNCIGFAFACWHHGGCLKTNCSCEVIGNQTAEKLRTASQSEANKLATKHVGQNVAVIRNGGKSIPLSKLKAGDICMLYKGSTYYHTIYYMGNGKYAESNTTGGIGNAKNIRADLAMSATCKANLKCAIRYNGK